MYFKRGGGYIKEIKEFSTTHRSFKYNFDGGYIPFDGTTAILGLAKFSFVRGTSSTVYNLEIVNSLDEQYYIYQGGRAITRQEMERGSINPRDMIERELLNAKGTRGSR